MTPEEVPDVVRLPTAMPPKPDWCRDVSHQLYLLPRDIRSEKDLEGRNGVDALSMAQVFDRAFLSAHNILIGETRAWMADLKIPEDAPQDRGLVLELDETRAIADATLLGNPVFFDRSLAARRWAGGEGVVFLPVSKPGQTVRLFFRAKHLTQLYPNGFGRLRLRTADLNETIRISQPTGGTVSVQNASPFPVRLKLQVSHEDFFGTPLAEMGENLEIGGGSALPLDLKIPKKPDLYKTRVQAVSAGQATFDYSQYYGREHIHHLEREGAFRLGEGWEYSVPKGPEKSPGTQPREGWKKVTLPHEVPIAEFKSNTVWYRKKFAIPEGWGPQRIFLLLPRVQYRAEFFIDGAPAGVKPNYELPGSIEITSHLKNAKEHELAIRVTNYTANLAPGLPVTAPGTASAPSRGLIAATSHLNQGNSYTGLDSIPEIFAAPALRTDWVAVDTRIDPSEIQGRFELVNQAGVARSVVLEPVVYDRGKKVLEFPSRTVVVSPAKTQVLEMRIPWEKPVMWNPEKPHLYELRTRLLDNTGSVLDERRDRFGFRQIGISGDHFTLNGARFNLYGTGHLMTNGNTWPVIPWSPRILRYNFKGENGFMQGLSGSRLADEQGIFIKNEMLEHNAHHGDRFAYQLPETWENLYKEMQAVYRVRPNEPSNFMWDVGNEVKFDGPGEGKKMESLFQRIRQMDPTRLVTVSGSVPHPPGFEIVDFHGFDSPRDRFLYFFFHPEQRPALFRNVGIYSQKPARETAPPWTVFEDKSFYQGLAHLGGRPFLLSESLYCLNPGAELNGLSTYHPLSWSSDWDRGNAHNYLNWATQRRNYLQFDRQAGVAGFLIHVDRAYTRAFSPLAAFPLDRKTRFYSGEKARMVYSLHNDMLEEKDVTVKWTVMNGPVVVATQQLEIRLKPAVYAPATVSLELPAEPGKDYALLTEMWASDGTAYFTDSQVLSVFDRAPIKLTGAARLEIFDPAGEMVEYLKKAMLDCVVRKNLDSLDPNRARGAFILIGPEALAGVAPDGLKKLRDMVNAGADVVVLAHRQLPKFLHFPITQTQASEYNRNTSVVAVVPDRFSSLTRDLQDDDFRFWTTRDADWMVQYNAIELPDRGNFRPHLLAGTQMLTESPLLEVREGAGRVLFCQLNIEGAIESDPMAHEMLSRILGWPGAESPLRDIRPTLVLAFPQSKGESMRARFGISGEVIQKPGDPLVLENYGVLVAPADDAETMAYLQKHESVLLPWLRQGNRLFLQGLGSEGEAWLSSLTGRTVKLEDFRMDRGYPSEKSRWMQGLSPSDFFWQGNLEEGARNITVSMKENSRALLGKKRLTGDGLTPLIDPAYAGVWEVGNGAVIVNLTNALGYPLPAPLRTLSMMLTNAGVSLGGKGAAQAATTRIPAERYFTLDLRAQANRPFADDPANTLRGWSGQGPDNDLRNMPLGAQTFKDIPFDIIDPAKNGGKSIIALSGTREIGVLPAEVKNIQVGRKVEELYFLHSASWGSPGFTYRVYYEDRKTWIPGMPDPFVDVLVKPEESITDWYSAGAVEAGKVFLPDAEVAWTTMTPESAKGNVKVGIYLMRWKNPKPDKSVDSIDILSPGKVGNGQPFVLGISGLKADP
ncbi:MAG: glycoside hydrolase family 2 TIM barrel-domain containing protein [Candidatus Methylacidiphilales bacterium]|nr:glycoside hydrolase family 2 TIM barrel-domain containing protein [Candidatus Methylacidiphilales bacterium]